MYFVALTFESVNKILKCDSMKNHEAVLPCSVNFNLQNYFLILPFLAWELLAVDSLNLHLLGALLHDTAF